MIRFIVTGASAGLFLASQALMGLLLAEGTSVSSGQVAMYSGAIAFLTGVAGLLAKLVQSLYQKIIDDKDAEITRLRKVVEECREQSNGD